MEVFAVFMVLFMILLIFLMIAGLYVLSSIIYKKILEKDNRNGMLGFIPFYRDYLLIEMSDMNWYWIICLYAPLIVGLLVSWVPFVGSIGSSLLAIIARVAAVNLYYNLTKKFKTEDWLLIVMALFPIIGLGILAFSSKYSYDKSVEVKPDGFFGDLGIIKKEEQPKKEEAPVKEAEVVPEEPKKKTTTKKSTNKKES